MADAGAPPPGPGATSRLASSTRSSWDGHTLLAPLDTLVHYAALDSGLRRRLGIGHRDRALHAGPTVLKVEMRTVTAAGSLRDSGSKASYCGWVPMLSALDELPHRPRRILVAGTSASGKTTLAARISCRLGVDHVVIDALLHGPGWTPRETFETEVEAFSAEPGWVTEWQYSTVRERLAQRADLLVWLDLSRATVMRRVVQRTVCRRLRRQLLWNGNVEPPLWTVFTDREHIVRWAWSTHHKNAQRIAAVNQQRPDLVIVRLRDGHAVEQWLNGPLRHAATLPTSPG